MSAARFVLTAAILVQVLLPGSGHAQSAPQVFFGNLHSHTSYSDGSGIPEDAYTMARDVARLDFLAITEHNHGEVKPKAPREGKQPIGRVPELYEGPDPAALLPTAARFSEPGRFVALYGQEWSSISKGNHVNVFDVPKVILPEDAPNGEFDKLVDWLNRPDHLDSTGSPAILQFNHPSEGNPKKMKGPNAEYGRYDFHSSETEWLRALGPRVCLIEVLNGPALKDGTNHKPSAVMEDDYYNYLNLGFRVAPTADQDNHFRNWGISTDARTAILAERLDKVSLLAAIRARHVYATSDKNLRLIFRVNGQLCGDVIREPFEPGAPLRVTYTLYDADEPTARYRIEAYSDLVGGDLTRLAAAMDVFGNQETGALQDMPFLGNGQYVFFRVIQQDGDTVWTSPVWFSREGEQGPISPAPGTETQTREELAGGMPAQETQPPAGAPPAGPQVRQAIASKRSQVYHISPECSSVKHISPANLITGEAAMRGRRLHQGCPVR